MNTRPTHHWLIYPFFKWYTIRAVKRHFSAVKVDSDVIDRNLPVLLISHHISWWDGFWANYLNMTLFKRKFWFMMLEEQLRKNWFFRFTGGYPVRKGSRSILESLRYTTELLNDQRNLVLLFPQGKIHSMYSRDFVFERGLEVILQNTSNPIHILFVAFLVDYFSNKKPSLHVHVTEYSGGSHDATTLGEHYTDFYLHCVEKQNKLTD